MDEPVKLKFLDVVGEKVHYMNALNFLSLGYIESHTVLEIPYEIKYALHFPNFLYGTMLSLPMTFREVLYRRANDMYFIYGHEDPYTPLDYPAALKHEFPEGSLCHILGLGWSIDDLLPYRSASRAFRKPLGGPRFLHLILRRRGQTSHLHAQKTLITLRFRATPTPSQALVMRSIGEVSRLNKELSKECSVY